MIKQKNRTIKPVVLIILDGWGIAPDSKGNAISRADTPNFDYLISNYKTISLEASGESVGLLPNQPSNSEYSHLNLGAGRIVYQPLPRINKAIEDKSFFRNPVFREGLINIKKYNSKLHLIGLVSKDKKFSSLNHFYALLDLAKKEGIDNVCLHLILDNYQPGKENALQLISEVKEKTRELNIGRISSLSGRNYTMDSDNNWERTKKSYLTIFEGKAEKIFSDPLKAISDSYGKNIFDEDLIPVIIGEGDKVEENDVLIFFNFNPQGMRQLGQSFVQKKFNKFSRPRFLERLLLITMTDYGKDIFSKIAFPSQIVSSTLSEIISSVGLKQLHLAETEKYIYVTYFFNGKRKEPFIKEDDIIISSPKVSSYEQRPEMSAIEIAKKAADFILEKKYDFIILNFANPDILGHTGNIEACIKGIETVDKALGILVEVLSSQNEEAIIMGDHGNAEEMINLYSDEIDRENSLNPVPLIFFGEEWKRKEALKEPPNLSLLKPEGILADVAPTILKIMGIKKPKEMTGQELLREK